MISDDVKHMSREELETEVMRLRVFTRNINDEVKVMSAAFEAVRVQRDEYRRERDALQRLHEDLRRILPP